MKVVCNSCEQTITVDDAKVPAGAFRIKCPSCSNLIIVSREESAVIKATNAPQAKGPESHPSSNVEEIVKREVAKAKKEIFDSVVSLLGADVSKLKIHQEKEVIDERKHALICDPEEQIVDQITAVLNHLDYQVESVKTSAEALKKLEQSTYQLVTVSSNFPDAKDGTAKILGRINGQKSAQRRQTFVVSISTTVKNTDATTAFLHGANIIVNKEDLSKLESLIQEGQRTFQQIYHHFSDLIREKEKSI
jgi:predicted Zn finger-like uncharacterized protein